MREVMIAKNIKTIRRERGYRSAAALCAALCIDGYECSASLVKSWEAGINAPSLIAISALCDVLNVSADSLLFGDSIDI